MKIAVVGAVPGGMGQMLIRQIARTEGSARWLPPAKRQAARRSARMPVSPRASANGIKIGGDSAAAIAAAQVVIDFTVPAATIAHAKVAQDKSVAMVIGTTGLDPQQTALIHEAAAKVPIMWAANMALGVNVLLALVEKTASLLDPDATSRCWKCTIATRSTRLPARRRQQVGAAAAGRKVKLEDMLAPDPRRRP